MALQAARTARTLVAALVCFLASIGVQYARERYVPPPPADESLLYLRSSGAVARLALGYDALLADVYWIRAVQYFGGQKLHERAKRRQDLLYPLLDITTTLDPQFNIAYRFGAVFLAEGYPKPPGRPDLAVKLLEKGFAANPTRWEYLYDAAFVHYWWLRDYAAAGALFTRASQVPGAPDWMQGLAATTLARGGNRQSARFMWQQVLENGESEYMRENARYRLLQLDAMDDLARLNSAISVVSVQMGLPLFSWDPLVERGWIRRAPPVDPTGLPYVMDRATGRARLSPSSSLYPLPEDMPAGDEPAGQERPAS